MRQFQDKVTAFHDKFNCPVGDFSNPQFQDTDMRLDLICEEVGELHDAASNNDIVAAADALGDILYVVVGSAVAWGLDLEPILNEIHRSNMAKAGGGRRADGKILKPADWTPPKIVELIEAQKIRGLKR